MIGTKLGSDTVVGEPRAQVVRHHALHREAARIGRSEDRPVWKREDYKARFDAGISVALRAIEGVDQLPRVSANEGRQNSSGEPVEIVAGLLSEIALQKILGELREHVL
jgi:hypothetical protein